MLGVVAEMDLDRRNKDFRDIMCWGGSSGGGGGGGGGDSSGGGGVWGVNLVDVVVLWSLYIYAVWD